MTQLKISETHRQAIIRAMAAARKAGYFAKHNFRACRNSAQDALREMGRTENYLYSVKNSQANGELHFYWNGDGDSLVNILKSEGLAVEWPGDCNASIKVNLSAAA